MTGQTSMMREPAVEPARWRADTRFLWPDLSRPGMAIRTAADPDVTNASEDPASLCERIERELAAEAWRYRLVLLIALVTLALPGALLGLWWASLDVVPLAFEPFSRGLYVPFVSLFEASAYTLLLVLFAAAFVHASKSVAALRRLGVDYRRLRDADDALRIGYAAEASTGEWPRVHALLRRGRGFEAYHPHLDSPGQR